MKLMKLKTALLVLLTLLLTAAARRAEWRTGGLVGVICEKSNFKEPASRDVIRHLNHDWTGGPNDWSAWWIGSLEGPHSGEVVFEAEADNGIKLEIDGKTVIDGLGRDKARRGRMRRIKGRKYPVKVWYFQDGDLSFLRLYWSWAGQERVLVNPAALSYSAKNLKAAVDALPDEYWGDDAPVLVTGKGSESLDFSHQDGRLAPVVGVQNYQVYRSNREHPELASELNFTYNHAPMLAYWNGRFYLEFLAAPQDEHQYPTVTLLASSMDGRRWSTPKVTFPAFTPEGDRHQTITHQRMGFSVSSDNRLLVLAFYGRWPSPNEGDGIGRVVREVYENNRLGPIYFIRYNRHAGWNESNTPYPFYRESPDAGFVAACDELLANKLRTQQWWEEDRSKDGFYAFEGHGFLGKAFSWYTRPDGQTVGFWKAGYAALSPDGGKTWTKAKKLPSIIVGHAKMWGQQTDDGRFAMVYNPHFEWRYPLVVNTGDDGVTFSNMAVVHGELPRLRYQGGAKDMGPQYVRGIVPGNGNPPGGDMWLTYSMSKEDIWVSRVPVPIRDRVEGWVDDTFDDLIPGGVVRNWNIYSPRWAPIDVVEFPSVVDKSLQLNDWEPCDYARAVRVFPQSKRVTVQFDLLAGQASHGRMEIDLLSRGGLRPIRLMLGSNGKVQAIQGDQIVDLQSYKANTWFSLQVDLDADSQRFSVSIDGKRILEDAQFAEKASSVERLSFRTGRYRRIGAGLGIGRCNRAADLPGAGEAARKATYHVNNVRIAP